MYKDIMWKVLASRADLCGRRLRSFKADGGLKKATGEIDWVKGCYTLIFRDGMLLEDQNGDKVPATHPISSDYTLTDNFNDGAAALTKPPSPPPFRSTCSSPPRAAVPTRLRRSRPKVRSARTCATGPMPSTQLRSRHK